MGLPSEELSLEVVDQQNNSALHLACLKVSKTQGIAIKLIFLKGHEESALIILDKLPDSLLLKSNSDKKT